MLNTSMSKISDFFQQQNLIFFYFIPGYPRNPFNDVVCNDTISASGVFTAKELCRLSKSSIMSGSSGMHGGGSSAGSGGLNGVKLEGPGYYCNSYTPPAPVDHGLLSTTYSK